MELAHCMYLKFFKMPLHSFDLGNVFVTCAWTVFLLCKVFVPQRSVGEAECGRISVWLCGKLLLLPQCWLKPQSQVDTLSVNADSLGENDAVGSAVAATFHFYVRWMCVRNLWFATASCRSFGCICFDSSHGEADNRKRQGCSRTILQA